MIVAHFTHATLAEDDPEPDLLCGVKCVYVGLISLEVDPGTFSSFVQKCGVPDARGYSIGRLEQVAQSFGVSTLSVQTSLDNLKRRKNPFVCVAHVDGHHFMNLIDANESVVWVIDPPQEKQIAKELFAQRWNGTALLLSRTPLVPEESLRTFPLWIYLPAACGVLVAFWLVQYKVFSR